MRDARQASRAAGEARQKAEEAVRERETAEAQARVARDRAQAAAVASLAQVSGIRAQREALLGQLAAAQGVWCLRVHDVASTLDAVRVTARWGAEAVG